MPRNFELTLTDAELALVVYFIDLALKHGGVSHLEKAVSLVKLLETATEKNIDEEGRSSASS